MERKDLIERLTVYQNKIKDRLSDSVPSKHKSHPESFKRFLLKELADVNRRISGIKEEMIGGKVS